MLRPRVVVTGIGLVTPLGHDARSTWAALLQAKSGAARIAQFDPGESPTTFGCEVKAWDASAYLPKKLVRELDRFSEFALVAADAAIADAGITFAEHAGKRAGAILGTGVGGLATIEEATRKLVDRPGAKLSPYVITAVAGNLAAGQISIRHGLRGPSYAMSSACATGAHAIGEAAEWIRRGRADVMIAGSAESPITPVALGGFTAMRALSRRNDASASRPFDRSRDGFVPGEGAAVLVLESEGHAKARGATILAELAGYGASSDAFHICAPDAEGDGAARSMEMALDDASLSPGDVDYVNAHATSTPLGDLAEARAIARVFGAHALDRSLSVSSTKSMTGHTLGAAGAIEAAISVLSIVNGVVPPTAHVDELDPAIAIDVTPNEARSRRVRHVVSNAFGFGGTNATLVLSAPHLAR